MEFVARWLFPEFYQQSILQKSKIAANLLTKVPNENPKTMRQYLENLSSIADESNKTGYVGLAKMLQFVVEECYKLGEGLLDKSVS